MPLLKRVLPPEELGEAPQETTAEQLFASSIQSQELRVQRRLAAAACSAPLVTMASLANKTDDNSALAGETVAEALSEDECVAAALLVAKTGWHVQFLGSDSKLVTKRLALAVSRCDAGMMTDLAAQCLHRVRFRPCRTVYELLCELDRVQQSWTEKPDPGSEARTRLVVVGPLCDLFSSFQTASGMTATGVGLKRMVELAIKRLRGTTSIHISIMQPEAN